MRLTEFFSRLRCRVARRPDRLLTTPVCLVDAQGADWDTARIGRFGEDVAGRWLRREAGCRVLFRNFRPRDGGELDLVVRDGETLVFVEVKTRTSTDFGRPALAVDATKQALIIRGARGWLSLLGWPAILFRFDVIEVVLREGAPPSVTWVRSAFNLPDHLRW